MSFSGQYLLTNLNYFRQKIGRKIKATKNYHLWEFNLNGIYHRIELYHSLVSGNIRVLLDGQILEKNLRFDFDIDGIIVEIIKKNLEDFDLYVGERTFNEMLKEEMSGKNRDLVAKKLEDLRKKNEKIGLNDNNGRKNLLFNQNIGINLDSDDDLDNENINTKKCRDDDDFYKSNGNNLDFSEGVFEKNKKILENINFFEEDNNNNNNNNWNNYNYNNNYNVNNNSNYQKENMLYNNINNFNEKNDLFNNNQQIGNSQFQNNQNYINQIFNNAQENNNNIYNRNYQNNFNQYNNYEPNNQFHMNYPNNFDNNGNKKQINMINNFDLFNQINI